MEAERQPWRRAGTAGMPPESGPRKPPRSVREEGRSKSKGALARPCRGRAGNRGGCQVMGVRGGEKRAPHRQLAGRRAPPGTRTLLSQPFPSGFPRVQTAPRRTPRWGRSRAWDGRGAAGSKEPCAPHRVGRAAHLAPGTHHLFRAASSALGCGLGIDKSTLWQRRLLINCHFNCQSAS